MNTRTPQILHKYTKISQLQNLTKITTNKYIEYFDIDFCLTSNFETGH